LTASMTAHSPISVALLGYGLAGRVFHAPLIEATPGLSLDAIVTRDPQRKERALATYPQVTLYDSPEQAWAAGHDLAVVATPNVTHLPYSHAALAAGLHVVLDKPIAPTAKDARALAEAAEAADRLLIPFQNRRWDSDFLTASRVAADDGIGNVHRFESRIERMRVVPKPGWRGSTDPADMGGMLYDLGAHLVDQALRLMGPVVSVEATVRSLRGVSDDDVVLLLRHASEAISVLVASQLGAFDGPRMTLYGTRGGLRVEASDSQESALAAGRTLSGDDWGREPDSSNARLRQYSPESVVTERLIPLERGAWPAFYTGVEDALHNGAAAPVLIGDVVEDLRVLDAARQSAATGQSVRLDPPAGHLA